MPNGDRGYRYTRYGLGRRRFGEAVGDVAEILSRYLDMQAEERRMYAEREQELTQVTLPSGEVVLQPKRVGLVIKPAPVLPTKQQTLAELFNLRAEESAKAGRVLERELLKSREFEPRSVREALTTYGIEEELVPGPPTEEGKRGLQFPGYYPERLKPAREKAVTATQVRAEEKAAEEELIKKKTVTRRRRAKIITRDLGTLYQEAKKYRLDDQPVPTELNERILSTEINRMRLENPDLQVFRSVEEFQAELPPNSKGAKMDSAELRRLLEEENKEIIKAGGIPPVKIHDKPRTKLSDYLLLLELWSESE